MGEIKLEVLHGHLNGEFADEIEIILPFTYCFDVTWATSWFACNTTLSVYFLKPSPFIAELYGIYNEIALFYSHYNSLEPRSIQAIDKMLAREPAKSRVEKLNCILVANTSSSVQEWIGSYAETVQDQVKVIIGFSAQELRENENNAWFVRNRLNKQFYSTDLFDYGLPLIKDTYFFGRRLAIGSFLDAIRKQENKGLFGLRKTGKTSILYKLRRMVESEKIADVFIYDCKDTSIRKLRWFMLIEKICKDIVNRYSDSKVLAKQFRQSRFDEINASSSFASIIEKLKGKKIIIIFDEIEWISFDARLDRHWKMDFIEFWQSFWTCQSIQRNLIAFVTGVNPSAVEVDSIEGMQNPLFGIVSCEFLKGFNKDEMIEMVKTLGSKMGLLFDEDSFDYLYERYGGHPYLTRRACSAINSQIKILGQERPVRITRQDLASKENERDAGIQHYCEHIVSELRQFYKDEYETLEYLAIGQVKDFTELAREQSFIRHLNSYGLIYRKPNGAYAISIPVVGQYIGISNARKEGRKTIYKIISPDRREGWLRLTIETLMSEIRFLERLVKQHQSTLVFGPNSFPEADRLAKLKVCSDNSDFESFINTVNRCFVESIEVYGRSISQRNYFWGDIKNSYPALFDALHRIKLYRHEQLHLELNSCVNENLLNYLKRDLEGRNPSKVEDLYFVLQQCVLDGLGAAIQVETDKFI